MILFFANREDHLIASQAETMSRTANIPVYAMFYENLIKEGKLQIENAGDDLVFQIQAKENLETIKGSEIKICYFAEYPALNSQWLPYESEYDISYAQNEWWASLNALFLSQPDIKFINPAKSKFELCSELEQLMIMQKFEIPTVEMILTNNPDEALKYYRSWNNSALYKSVTRGYANSALMNESDIDRLNKLSLSPAIFQKPHSGSQMTVCLLGNNYLAVKLNDINEYELTDIPDFLLNKIVQVSEYIERPLVLFNFLYQEASNEYCAYSMNVYPSFYEIFSIFGDSYFKLLTAFLAEEYKS